MFTIRDVIDAVMMAVAVGVVLGSFFWVMFTFGPIWWPLGV